MKATKHKFHSTYVAMNGDEHFITIYTERPLGEDIENPCRFCTIHHLDEFNCAELVKHIEATFNGKSFTKAKLTKFLAEQGVLSDSTL